MDDPQSTSREIEAILPFVPIMLIAGILVALLTNSGAADAGRGTLPAGAPALASRVFYSPITTTLTATTAISGYITGGSSCPTATVPISGAVVLITSTAYITSYATTSDISGTYGIMVPAPAVISMTASAPGYTSTTVYTSTISDTMRVDFCLTVAITTPTPTATSSPTPSSTATSTPTATATGSATASSTATATSPPTVSSTAAATSTPTDTSTPTATATQTASPTSTAIVVSGSQKGIIAATTGGSLSTQDGRVTIIVPAGTIDGNTSFVLIPRTMSDVPATPSALNLGSNLFSLEAYYNTSPITSFRKPITVRAKYSAADVAAAGGDTSRLSVAYFSSPIRSWLPNSNSKVWPADSVIESSISQPGMMAVVIGPASSPSVRGSSPVSPRVLPRTGGGDGVNWLMALFVAGIVSAMAGVVVRELVSYQRK